MGQLQQRFTERNYVLTQRIVKRRGSGRGKEQERKKNERKYRASKGLIGKRQRL